MRASVILNVRSRHAGRYVDELPSRLRERGIEVERTILVEGHRRLRKRLRALRKRDTDVVLVGGGDGTMRVAAEALAHSAVTLGVLPFGTGNSFAQTLGIAPNLDHALDVIAAGRREHVDLGHVNGRTFVNFAVIGLSAEIADATPRPLKAVFGKAAYALAGVVPFLRARGFAARVRWDAGELELRTQQLIVASGRCFGSVPLVPGASAANGLLAFFAAGGTSHLAVARAYVALGIGEQQHLPDAHAFFASEIRIATHPKTRVSVDGSSGGKTPAVFRVEPGALRVFVPPLGVPA